MPGFDGNGPMGEGPMTGGARGYCNRPETGYAGPYGFRSMMAYGRGYRKGLGMRRGFGRSWKRGFGAYAPENSLTAEKELAVLKKQADSVRATLDSITQRIAEIEK